MGSVVWYLLHDDVTLVISGVRCVNPTSQNARSTLWRVAANGTETTIDQRTWPPGTTNIPIGGNVTLERIGTSQRFRNIGSALLWPV